MDRISLDEAEPRTADGGGDRRTLTGPLNAANVAVNHYTLAPGERFSGSVHAHADQEEVFLVVEGEATFETEEGTVPVGAGEAVRFAPGEFQSGRNDSDCEVVAFALGAPRDSEDIRVSRIPALDRDIECPDCGRGDMRIPDDAGSGLVCPDCGAELRVE